MTWVDARLKVHAPVPAGLMDHTAHGQVAEVDELLPDERELAGVVRVVEACAGRQSLELRNQSRDPGGNGNLDITVNRGYRESEL
jgi:hypothetical protein